MVSDWPSRLRVAALPHAAPSSDFDLDPDLAPAVGKLQPAAVLLAVFLRGEEADLLLTKRSSALRHHPGQIALPGGRIDAEDSGPEEAALREAREEVGLPPELVEVIGRLPHHRTVTGYDVCPVLGIVRAGFSPVPEPSEVDEAFFVPLDAVLDPARFSVQSRRWRGRRRHYYTVPHGPYYIWGATARILKQLSERVSE